jgi:hypothetical protein
MPISADLIAHLAGKRAPQMYAIKSATAAPVTKELAVRFATMAGVREQKLERSRLNYYTTLIREEKQFFSVWNTVACRDTGQELRLDDHHLFVALSRLTDEEFPVGRQVALLVWEVDSKTGDDAVALYRRFGIPEGAGKMMTYEEARESAGSAGSFGRMERVLNCAYSMKREDWLRLLGEEWSGCDRIGRYRHELRAMLGTSGPIREMMTPEENAAYDKLPERVQCWRGCDASRLLGASWSLDKAVANSFPFRERFYAPNPVLVTAVVRKDRILAVKLDRNEIEIVTFSARRVNVETADRALADQCFQEESERRALDNAILCERTAAEKA